MEAEQKEEIKKEIVDWNERIDPKYIIEKDGRKFVLLHGLRLVAAEKGYKERRSELVQQATPENGLRASVKFTYKWNDGTIDEAVADACPENIGSEPFSLYPTVIAMGRSEAVCIRTALKINIISVEELKDEKRKVVSEKKFVSEQQRVAIKNLMKKYEVTFTDLLNESNVNGTKFTDVTQIQFNKLLDNFTEEQGTKLLGYLSGLSSKSMAIARVKE